MELTRRHFIITSSLTSLSIATPSLYLSTRAEVFRKYEDFKGFANEHVSQMDKYLLAEMIPYLLSMLYLS